MNSWVWASTPGVIRSSAFATSPVDAWIASIRSIKSAGTEALAETIPMRRLGKPEEVARTIYYLCTDASAYVNGVEIEINGGQHV